MTLIATLRRPTLAGALLGTLVLLAFNVGPAAAAGDPVTKGQAKQLAKRAASRQVARYGISYPPSMWIAGCKRWPAKWVCGLRTDTGQCFGSVHVIGTATRPRAREVRVYCGE